MLAYDDVKAIRYFALDLVAYWRRNGMSMEQLLADRRARGVPRSIARRATSTRSW